MLLTDPGKKHETGHCLTHLRIENKKLRVAVAQSVSPKKLKECQDAKSLIAKERDHLRTSVDRFQRLNYDIEEAHRKAKMEIVDYHQKRESLLVQLRDVETMMYLLYQFATHGPDSPEDVDGMMNRIASYLSTDGATRTIENWRKGNQEAEQ